MTDSPLDLVHALCRLSAQDRALLHELALVLAAGNSAVRALLRSQLHVLQDAVSGQGELPLRGATARIRRREDGTIEILPPD